MLKRLSICATLVAIATGLASAQQEATLHKMHVPDADFDLIFVIAKTQTPDAIGQRGPGDALVVQPIGDELAFATNEDMERVFGASRYPIHAIRVERKDGVPSSAVHVYIVSKTARGAP